MLAKTFPHCHSRFWILLAIGSLAASLSMGCSKDWNAEYKPTAVTGKVVRKDGKPLIGEMVISLVTSEGSPQVRSQGLVKVDGTITGLTFVGIGGDGRPGMIPGRHYVEFNRVQKIGDDAEPADAAKDQA